jgi:hypothetical protein
MAARGLIAVLLGAAILAGCAGANATPTPCVVSYPPAIGANLILYYPDTTDAQCSSRVDPVPGAARLLAVPTGAPLCSGTTPKGDAVKVFGDSLASHALCIGMHRPAAEHTAVTVPLARKAR